MTDLATFEEAVGSLVDATVAEAGSSESETVRAMATRLDKAVQALRVDLPKLPESWNEPLPTCCATATRSSGKPPR